MENSDHTILVGNSFPLSLIRRAVRIEPVSRESLLASVQGRRIVSFWGHANTLSAVRQCFGLDLTPSVERPVLGLSPDNLPMFDGQVFHECFILSPDYQKNFRPAIGLEVAQEDIVAWQVLRITWD
ncbi:MAG: hypothetical protein IJS15_09940 [Victivallales bacterium]|nr:hypothetical protein [Victivallales bacterium]